ncbi:MAG: outer membrane beta-barrel protein [Calditrichaceae bacterium]|jgi:hypothetical protein
MRKVSIFIVMFVVVLMFSTSSFAQNEYRPFGIGVNVLDLNGIMSGAGATVYLPINLAPGFRLEPLIGLNITSDEYDSGAEYSQTDMILGIGIFPTIRKGNAVIYVGGRVGIGLGSSESKNSNGDKTSDQSDFSFGLGPALGGEYYFNPHLSLGGEVSIMYRHTTMTDKAIFDYEEDQEDTESSIGTQGLVFIRFYF